MLNATSACFRRGQPVLPLGVPAAGPQPAARLLLAVALGAGAAGRHRAPPRAGAAAGARTRQALEPEVRSYGVQCVQSVVEVVL